MCPTELTKPSYHQESPKRTQIFCLPSFPVGEQDLSHPAFFPEGEQEQSLLALSLFTLLDPKHERLRFLDRD